MLNGYLNRQNCRFSNEDQPDALQTQKITVWFDLWIGGIIGIYSFKVAANHNLTVHGERYRKMISDFFLSKMHENDIWFQQDDGLTMDSLGRDKM